MKQSKTMCVCVVHPTRSLHAPGYTCRLVLVTFLYRMVIWLLNTSTVNIKKSSDFHFIYQIRQGIVEFCPPLPNVNFKLIKIALNSLKWTWQSLLSFQVTPSSFILVHTQFSNFILILTISDDVRNLVGVRFYRTTATTKMKIRFAFHVISTVLLEFNLIFLLILKCY